MRGAQSRNSRRARTQTTRQPLTPLTRCVQRCAPDACSRIKQVNSRVCAWPCVFATRLISRKIDRNVTARDRNSLARFHRGKTTFAPEFEPNQIVIFTRTRRNRVLKRLN